MAMGAAMGEHWVVSLPVLWRQTTQAVFFTGLVACGVYICALVLPLASTGALREFALKNNGDLREEIGWENLVKAVADIRNSLPPEQQRQDLRCVVGNYGEQGAIEILDPAYDLPPPIRGTNSAWLRGYPDPPPSTLIVVGFSRDEAERTFTGCRRAGHNGNPYGVERERPVSS